MDIAKKIQLLLDERGWRQADLARAGPFDPQLISQWVRGRPDTGRPSKPSYPYLKRLSEISGKDLSWWLS